MVTQSFKKSTFYSLNYNLGIWLYKYMLEGDIVNYRTVVLKQSLHSHLWSSAIKWHLLVSVYTYFANAERPADA